MNLRGQHTYLLPVTTGDGEVRLPPRLRETHLTPQTDTAVVQPIGDTLRIWVFSENDTVCVTLPLEEWCAEKPFRRRIHRWGVNVNRWVDKIDTVTEDGDLTVEASVAVVDIDAPEEVTT